MKSLEGATAAQRIMGPSLKLGAVVIWVMNSLIFRPGEQRWDQVVIPASAAYEGEDVPEDADEEELAELVAEGRAGPMLEDRGCYFVGAVEWDRGVFRCPIVRELSGEEYALIYHTGTMDQLAQIFKQSHQKKQTKERLQQRPQRRRVRLPRDGGRYSPQRDVVFGLEEAGVTMGPSVVLRGRDVEEQGMRRANVVGEMTVDVRVNKIWQQFLRDLMRVASVGREGPYSLLSEAEVEEVTERLYQESELPFREAIVKTVEPTTWDVTLFGLYFPTRRMSEGDRGRRQHYNNCGWWIAWNNLVDQIGERDVEIVRDGLLGGFRQLAWLPYSTSDRIWATGKKEKGRYVKLPEGSTQAAVKIALNARAGYSLSVMKLRV